MRIARPFGIPVFISPYWFLIAGLFVFLYAHNLNQSVPGNLRYLVAAAFVVLLYASVLVHELSHSVVAQAFGLPVRRILLYPLGGFSEIEQEPPTPGRELRSPRPGRASHWPWPGLATCCARAVHPAVYPASWSASLWWRTCWSASSTCCPACRWTGAGCSGPGCGR